MSESIAYARNINPRLHSATLPDAVPDAIKLGL